MCHWFLACVPSLPIFQTVSGRSLSALPLVVAAHLHTQEDYFLLLSTFPPLCLSPLVNMHLSKQFSVSFPDRGWWEHIEEHVLILVTLWAYYGDFILLV